MAEFYTTPTYVLFQMWWMDIKRWRFAMLLSIMDGILRREERKFHSSSCGQEEPTGPSYLFWDNDHLPSKEDGEMANNNT